MKVDAARKPALEHGAPDSADDVSTANPFRSRDFLLYFSTVFLSRFSYDVSFAAIYWQVYELSGSEFQLGITGLFQALPLIGFGLWGGAVADRWDRRIVLQVCQGVFLATALGLTVLTAIGLVQIYHLYLAVLIGGIVLSFEAPARGALIANVLRPKQLMKGIALTSTATQLAQMLGPATAGLTILAFGLAGTYLGNAAVYAFIIVALWAVRARPARLASARVSTLKSIGEGLRFIHRTPIVWMMLSLDLAATFFASYKGLLPVFARDILEVGVAGLRTARNGASSRLGHWRGAGGRLRQLSSEGLAGPWRGHWLRDRTADLLPGPRLFHRRSGARRTGFCDAISSTVRRTVLQLETPDHLRGRAGSVQTIVAKGGPSLGYAQAGLIASLVGAPASLAIGALISLAYSLAIGIRGRVVRDYES